MKKFYVITLFPDVMKAVFSSSMLWKAQKDKLVEINVVDLRKYGLGKRRQVDDTPYGGGGGMVMKPEPIYDAVEAIKKKDPKAFVILLTPQGEIFHQPLAERLLRFNRNIVLVAGHYEGFDERVRKLADLELSVGKYVVTGGEMPAAIVVDAVTRLIPGVLGAEKGAENESFSRKLKRGIEYPHYTRPESFRGMKVPKVLLSGHHEDIHEWRLAQSERKTNRKIRKGRPGV